MESTTIRPEAPGDREAIHEINRLAFGQTSEAILVDALRTRVAPYLSLVALIGEELVGHILFTPVTLETSGDNSMIRIAGLAPMAVLPRHQRQGIGSQLVNEGLEACRDLGYKVVVVVGHANYYPQFGFVRASRKGLRCEYDVPDEVFMVRELEPNALRGVEGLIKFHPEFGKV